MNPSIWLRTEGLSRRFGSLVVNDDVCLSFAPGSRHAIIGPNGAGKTTFINLLAGALAPNAGSIWLGDEEITRLPQHARVKRGLARTFQINALFDGLTPLESVLIAIFERERLQRRWLRSVASHSAQIEEAMSLLASLRLDRDAQLPTRQLPYGKQRLLELALALATQPKILLLDEPTAGLPAAESLATFELIDRLPRDVTLIFIEHDVQLVFRFAERVTVMAGGRVLTEGSPEEVARDARVKEIYLGEATHG